jgi:ABC-type taurine transport system ATPase subunit
MALEFQLHSPDPSAAEVDCVVVGVYADASLSPAAALVDAASGGRIAALAARGDVSGKTGRTALLQDLPGVKSARVLTVGLGDKAKFADRARALLRTVGLDGYADKFPWELSGGMQQRASICRALVHQPKMLLLDEPFGALDAFTRDELWCLLRDLWSEQRFTVILVTHDLREAVFLADTVYVMSSRPGRILTRREVEKNFERI